MDPRELTPQSPAGNDRTDTQARAGAATDGRAAPHASGSGDTPAPPVTVRVRREGGVAVPLPTYQTDGAAGLDLCAALSEPVELKPLQRRLIPTGFSLELPAGFEAQVRPRSGLALRHGVTVLNSPGTVDWDYRGQVQVLLVNLGADPFTVEPLQRIAQLVVAPVTRAVLVWSDGSLSETARGSGGYGSTGR